MSVIDKNMYENLKNWCDRKRPENQFLMYVNMHDRELTNATIRKLMFEEDKQDVEGELYIAFYSAENFYRNMRDYFSHVGGMYFREPGEDDPIEDIIKDLPPTCGWITLIVEDMDALSGQNDKLQEMMRAFSAFAAKRASVILVGKGNHEDVFAGCEYALDKMAAGLEAKEEDNLLMIGCYEQEVSNKKEKVVYETLEEQSDDLVFYWDTIYDQLKENYFEYGDFKTLFRETLEYLVPRVTGEMVYRKDLWLIEGLGEMRRDKDRDVDGCEPWEFDAAVKFADGLHNAVINTFGYNDEFSDDGVALSVIIDDPKEEHGAIHISGYMNTTVTVDVESVCQEMDELAETIHRHTYKGDPGHLWKYLMDKRHGGDGKEIPEEAVNPLGALMDGIKEAADKTFNKDQGRKVHRYKGSTDEDDDQASGENKGLVEIRKKEYDVAPEKIKGYEKIKNEDTEDLKECKLFRFTAVLNRDGYTINADGEPEMTRQAQKEYDDFLSSMRQEMTRDSMEILEEGAGEDEDELEWHITGCFMKKGVEKGIGAIVEFDVCVRTEDEDN